MHNRGPVGGWRWVARGVAGWGIACLLVGCTDLPTADRLRCGNGIHEPEANEDCDGLGAGSPLGCGAVGTEAACRFVCADTACPAGWACGVDRVCRAPAGRFEDARIFALPGEAIELGDLDGDGLLDIAALTLGSLSVAFGARGASFDDVHVAPLPTISLPMALGDLNGDAIDDIALLVEGTALAFRGNAQRLLSPILVPTAPLEAAPSFALPLRTADPFDADEILILGQGAAPPTLLGRSLDAGALQPFLQGEPTLAEHQATGDLDGGGSETELALAVVGADTVPIVRVECRNLRRPCVVVVDRPLALPAGWTVNEDGTHFGDLDGDGTLDVLVAARREDRRALFVSYAPEGVRAPLEEAPGLAAAAGCEDCPRRTSAGVQLVADLVGDRRADLVTATEIWQVVGSPPRLRSAYRIERPIGAIQAADVDGDGRDDVLGSLRGSLVFILTGEDGDFAEFTAPVTVGSALTTGDFDGDRRIDVAYVTDDAAIEILFGGANGLPSERIHVGRTEGRPRLLRSARRAGFNSVLVDRAAELVVLTELRGYLLYGSGSRLPRTPIGLSDPGRPTGPGMTPAARSITIGTFAGAPSLLVGLSSPMPDFAELRLLSGADLAEPPQVPPISGCETRSTNNALSLAVDWDGDGKDELLYIDGVGPGPVGTSLGVYHLRLGEAGASCNYAHELPTTQAAHRLVTPDLDGDSRRDLVVFLRSTGATLRGEDPDGAARGASLAIWWRRPNGTLTDHTVFELPGRVSAVEPIALGDGRETLVAFTDGGGFAFDPVAGALAETPLLAAPAGVVDARAGDVDADGLADLVLKTTTSVFVFRQASCSAREAWSGTCDRPEP